jgi:hypothetical protein
MQRPMRISLFDLISIFRFIFIAIIEFLKSSKFTCKICVNQENNNNSLSEYDFDIVHRDSLEAVTNLSIFAFESFFFIFARKNKNQKPKKLFSRNETSTWEQQRRHWNIAYANCRHCRPLVIEFPDNRRSWATFASRCATSRPPAS